MPISTHENLIGYILFFIEWLDTKNILLFIEKRIGMSLLF